MKAITSVLHVLRRLNPAPVPRWLREQMPRWDALERAGFSFSAPVDPDPEAVGLVISKGGQTVGVASVPKALGFREIHTGLLWQCEALCRS